MRSATGEWHLSTQIKADMAKLIELGAKSEEQTAKLKFKPFPTKPELPSEMETKERQLRSQMKFLRGCAAQGHVVPLHHQVFDRMVGRLPQDLLHRGVPADPADEPRLRKALRLVFEGLESEVYDLYEQTVRESIVNHLTDVQEDNPLQEGMDFSTEWRKDFEGNKDALGIQLQLVHPVIRQMLAVWHRYSETQVPPPPPTPSACSSLPAAARVLAYFLVATEFIYLCFQFRLTPPPPPSSPRWRWCSRTSRCRTTSRTS